MVTMGEEVYYVVSVKGDMDLPSVQVYFTYPIV